MTSYNLYYKAPKYDPFIVAVVIIDQELEELHQEYLKARHDKYDSIKFLEWLKANYPATQIVLPNDKTFNKLSNKAVRYDFIS